MNAIKELMEQLWVIKDQDKELYFDVRADIDRHSTLIENLGFPLYVNEKLIKLEKVPGTAQPFMGISEMQSILDYMLLCTLLAFLDDRAEGQGFLLSDLTGYARAYFLTNQAHEPLDWTKIVHRRALIRVMKYAERIGLVLVNDGVSDDFEGDSSSEVLYENTGISRYFSVQFPYDISGYTCAADFAAERFPQVDTERGTVRINRVYRKLALSPAMYWDSAEDADLAYLKNQRPWVSKYLEEHLGLTLHLHPSGAFAVAGPETRGRQQFPDNRGVSDVTLFFCRLIREMTSEGKLHRDRSDRITMDRKRFTELAAHCRELYGSGWSKHFREELSDRELSRELLDYMESWMLLERENNTVRLLPAVGKFACRYPPDFIPGATVSEDMLPEQMAFFAQDEEDRIWIDGE